MALRPGLEFQVEGPEIEDEEEGATAFPEVETQSAAFSLGTPGNNGPYTITLPADIEPGDLLLALVISGITTLTPYDGWTHLFSDGGTGFLLPNPDLGGIHAWYKYADGTEEATLSWNPNPGSNCQHSYIILRISGAQDEPEWSSIIGTAITFIPNSTAVAPTWGADRNLYISFALYSFNVSVVDPPDAYTDALPLSTALLVAYRQRISTSEDPGPWEAGSSAGWVAVTLAIRPTQVVIPAPSDLTIIEEFVYRLDQKYLLMLSNNELRIVEDGGILVRDDIDTEIDNRTFINLSGWTNYSTGSSTAEGADGEGLILFCDGVSACGVRQAVPCTHPDELHALDIEVTRGPVLLRIGSGSTLDDILPEMTLRSGIHRISFTPSSTFYVDFSSSVRREVIVFSASISDAGDVVLDTPWDSTTLRSLRMTQDLNVMYITDGVTPKRRLERHGSGSSWSLVLSDEQDGPFGTPNVDETILVTPSTRSGNGTLTSNKALWRDGDLGSLVKITQNGQYESRTVNGADQWSDPVRVTGVGDTRSITWTVAGTFSATVRLQRSVGNDSSWENTSGGTGTQTATSASSYAYNDGQDNVVIYYRVGIASGEYTSGSADLTIFFAGGSTDGIARITGLLSDLVVEVEVLQPFAALSGSSEWTQGSWSDRLGWPRATAIWDGRLWNGLEALYWGSVSEVYESMAAGDEPADAIARSIGVGSQAPSILWLLPLNRLVVGSAASSSDVQPITVQTGLMSIQASSLDEAVTNTNLTVRSIDATGIYVDQSGVVAQEVAWDGQIGNYRPKSLMRLHRDLGRPGIIQIAAAYRPDPRLFMVRSDGTLLVKLYDNAENVLGWCRFVTDGLFESVAVLPATDEDEVYVVVRRAVQGVFKRYLEKVEPFTATTLIESNRLDSYVRYENEVAFTNVPASTYDHLLELEVQVWANGTYIGTRTIAADGTFDEDLPRAVTNVAAGLAYSGFYTSSKLALGAQAGTAIAQLGRPSSIAFMLQNSTRHIEFGQDFDTMDFIPDRGGADLSYDTGPLLVTETTEFLPVPGGHTNDPRLCIRMSSPHPVRIQGLVLAFHLDEKVKA